MGVADVERQELADQLERVGPNAPTLCAGWLARDLAAHLVLREHRLDAAPGILLPALASRTERVQHEIAARPWPELVETIRQGPPALSPYRIDAVNQLVNSPEFFVHLEDVRRVTPGWTPRPADRLRDDTLWARVRLLAKLLFRTSPVGIAMARADTGELVLARRGPRTVTISGAPGELLLLFFGRAERKVDFDGDQGDILVAQSRTLGL